MHSPGAWQPVTVASQGKAAAAFHICARFSAATVEKPAPRTEM